MKVTFIYHSSFFVELDSHCLLFDYFQGDIPQVDKPLYVFASHSHEDHFSPEIFQLAQPGKEVHFLLSDDISPRQVPPQLRDQVTFVSPRSFYEVGELKVATLRSTDMGVAFLIQCEGKRIYHAGDLNCWEWDGAPRVQNDQMVQVYTAEMELLRDKEIDVAFVPLDPRQEQYYAQGMTLLLQVVQPKHVFPMHMWGDYSVVPRFQTNPNYEEYAPLIQNVTRPGQSFTI
ncbi:MAG: MBL fold metallo-hydrolase [Acutalibacter sp.]|jgi:L-ascorbate metabolism protein UlaG (beta-lactamase superfamily)